MVNTDLGRTCSFLKSKKCCRSHVWTPKARRSASPPQPTESTDRQLPRQRQRASSERSGCTLENRTIPERFADPMMAPFLRRGVRLVVRQVCREARFQFPIPKRTTAATPQPRARASLCSLPNVPDSCRRATPRCCQTTITKTRTFLSLAKCYRLGEPVLAKEHFVCNTAKAVVSSQEAVTALRIKIEHDDGSSLYFRHCSKLCHPGLF